MGNTETELKNNRRKGGLIRRKLAEYIPTMILTNLSLFLITTVNGMVAGNFVGKEAFSSVNIFYSVTVLIGAFTTITAVGISISLSTAMGRNDMNELSRVIGASVYVMIGMAVFTGIVQIPIVALIISSYHLPPEVNALTWQYAAGIMLCTPFSLISTVGTYELQISGKMKVLMALTVAEGLSNLVFDLLFVAFMNLGVAGAGYGTLCANIVRCSSTVIYIWRKTDFFKKGNYKPCFKDFKEILICGVPDASFPVASAFQSYFMLRILIHTFGMDGPVINGVVVFCLSLGNVIVLGIQAGIRPLMGLYVGAEDRVGVKELMRQGAGVNVGLLGIITALVELFPTFFYRANGIDSIPEDGVLCVRLFAVFFIFRGLSFLLRLYLSNRKDIRVATWLTLGGNAMLPLFALILSETMPAPCIFLSHTLTELLLILLSYRRFRWWLEEDKKENLDAAVLYMDVKPENAVESSRLLRQFADEHGIEKRVSYRVALCMEEMVAYVKSVKRFSLYQEDDTVVEIQIRFKDRNNAVFISLDDGECISFDKDEEKQRLITNNYDLIRRVAKDVEYQYILNMNYTKITFQSKLES